MKNIPSISRRTSGRDVASMIKKRCAIRKGDEKKIRLSHEKRITFRRYPLNGVFPEIQNSPFIV
jgi:hypothetical protein